MKKILVTFLGFLVLAPAVGVLPVVAAAPGLAGATTRLDQALGGTGLNKEISTPIADIISAVLALVGTIFLALTVYAGALWMTAQGNETQVEKAKSIVTSSIIGMAVVFSAYAITAFVTSRFTKSGAVQGQQNGVGVCVYTDGSNTRQTIQAGPSVCSAFGGTWSQ